MSPYNDNTNRRLLQSVSSAVNITYELVVKTKHSTYASAGEVLTAVKVSLVASVNNGNFDDLLFVTATSYQVQTMLGVTSSSVVITNVETVPNSSTTADQNSTKNPPPAITGIVITIGFLAVIVASIFYYYQSKKTTGKLGNANAYNQVSLESDSTHSSINPLSAKVADEDEEIEIELANRTNNAGYGLVKNPLTADSSHGLV